MVIRLVVVVALVGWGCQSNPGPSIGKTSGSGSGAAAGRRADTQPDPSNATGDEREHVGSDPWSDKAKPTAPESPETRRKRAEAALARVGTIAPKLETIRALTFDRQIPREYQSAADFRKFVQTEIGKELPPRKAADLSEALHHIGLLEKPGNLAVLLEQAFITQAGAYYDPVQRKFFLVMVPDSELVLDTISAHELTHGLQDQHFDLRTFLPEATAAPALNEDERAARQFVVEGDATFAMFLYALSSMTNSTQFEPKMLSLLSSQLADFAAKSPQQLIKENAAGFSSMDPEIRKSIDAMNDIPMTVLVPMINSYTYGAKLVAAAFEKGGWPSVNALYKNPPASTEQVLHPNEKLLGHIDRPQRVTLAKTATAELVNLVLGELQWQIYFSLWVPDLRTVASEGWDGDRISVAKRPDGRLVARIATTWDTPGDAQEFFAAFEASLRKRFPDAAGDPKQGGLARSDNSGRVFIRRAGSSVFIIDGGDDVKELDALARTTKVRTLD